MADQDRWIDVYNGDGLIAWQKVLDSGIRGAFLKASQGASWVDKSFPDNWTRCGQVGLTRAPYHFFTGDAGGRVQAAHALSVVSLPNKSMPWVLDLEQAGNLSPDDLQENALHWLEIVEQATGKTPIIYGNRSFLEQYLQAESVFARYPLWLAHPGSDPGRVPAPWTSWTFWQCGFGEDSTGWQVPGCPSRVDANVYNGSHADLVQQFNLV